MGVAGRWKLLLRSLRFSLQCIFERKGPIVPPRLEMTVLSVLWRCGDRLDLKCASVRPGEFTQAGALVVRRVNAVFTVRETHGRMLRPRFRDWSAFLERSIGGKAFPGRKQIGNAGNQFQAR